MTMGRGSRFGSRLEIEQFVDMTKCRIRARAAVSEGVSEGAGGVGERSMLAAPFQLTGRNLGLIGRKLGADRPSLVEGV